jgi:hypothetical protein
MRQALRGASLLFTALEFTGITRADDRIDKAPLARAPAS